MPAIRHDPVITLTTDFGLEDPFVGVMKGVILSINPRATIIDLAHGIPSHDVRAAAFTIGMNYEFFPERTVHVVVVDPGVGSRRRPILAVTERHYFVGPDNGVFSMVCAKEEKMLKVIHITAEHFFLRRNSPTFQGRDVFSPVAAWISAGKHVENFGEPVHDWAVMDLPRPRMLRRSIRGEIVLIDKFGNCISNICQSDINDLMREHPGAKKKVFIGERAVPLREYYAQAAGRSLSALVNSSEHLEFFQNQDSAARKSRIRIGQKVELRLSP